MDASRELESIRASIETAQWLLDYYARDLALAGIRRPDLVWMTPAQASRARRDGHAVPLDEVHRGFAYKAWTWRRKIGEPRSPSTTRTVPMFIDLELEGDEVYESDFDEDTEVNCWCASCGGRSAGHEDL